MWTMVSTWLLCLGPWLLAAESVVYLNELTELRVCSSNILRLTKWPSQEAKAKGRISLVARSDWPEAHYEVHHSVQDIQVTTSDVSFTFSKATEWGTFESPERKQLILMDAGHSFTATEDMGKKSYKIRQSWQSSNPSEAFYGGGSYQNGLVNYKNAPLSMIQFNLEAVVPFFVSSENYGLLWDNYAWTYLNPPEKQDALVKPIDGKGQSGEVNFQAAEDGDYYFHVGRLMDDAQVPSFGGGRETIITAMRVGDNQTLTIVRWTRDQNNHPSSITGRLADCKAREQYIITFSFDIPGAGLYVQGPGYDGGVTTLESQYGEAIDYYFVLGKVDRLIAGYRQITGSAPLYGKFAYGFWQSREHYASQAELLQAAQQFRDRGIPLDAIVQDWLYWGKLGWGPEWDPGTYPDPAQMLKQLDQMNLRLMVSVWGKMDNQTALFKALKSAGMILGNTNQSHNNWYDAWSVDAQKIYYSICNQSHFSIGVESLWLDATEPEGLVNVNQETHLGSGNLLMNSYSLQTTSGIAEGLRRDYPEAQGARVFSLTRSSFAGQQRTGAALWTGDTSGTWDMLRRQVASSINYPLSGIPYWSQDIGGFFRPKDQYDSEQYHQLLIRWFQFGVFTPIFRVHGAGTHTEIWNFGNDTMTAINSSAITLRYRLLPYIYSGFWMVETTGYTMQRGLVFDFPDDQCVWNVADQYMFGPSLLVTPIVSNASATARDVYFPRGSWVNFHTGKSEKSKPHTGTPSGPVSRVNFEMNQAPFFVRAGSILVLGPELQYANQKSPKDLEVRIYKGGDVEWVLFEDDGHSSKYQKGTFSTITFSWFEQQGLLKVSEREGSFAGMDLEKNLCIVFVSEGHGVGVPKSSCDKEVVYSGHALNIKEDSETSAIFA